MTGLEELPGWAQAAINFGLAVGAALAVAFGYFRRMPPRQATEITVAGGLVSGREVAPLVAAIERLAESIENGSEQRREHLEEERKRVDKGVIDDLRREIEEMKAERRGGPRR